jgi:hypothetical protein
LLGGVAIAGLALARPASALDTTVDNWQVNIDTTLSSSVDFRTSPQDPNFIGVANGGKFILANNDNGDLNFKDGSIVAALQRVTTELQVKRDDYGFFVRATGFIDPVIDGEDVAFQKFGAAGLHDIGADLRLLDAYAFARPSIFGHSVDLRVGNQALNWGESSFIQFGINSINPLDATALRTPGSELRQGFLPIPVVDLRTDIGGGYNLEGFWQFQWTRSRLEPVGSFFGTGDSVFDGGTFANLTSYAKDNYQSIYTLDAAAGNIFGASLPRSLDRHPTTLDEFGFALRKTFESLDDTELGLYFENYHSRTPFVSIRTGSPNILAPGLVLPNPPALLFSAVPSQSVKDYDSTASIFDDYPRDIHLVGFSWNFTGPDGIAVQGELSSRLNQPIQLSGSDLSLAADVPAIRAAIKELGPVPALVAALNEANNDPTIQALNNQLGFSSIADGWKRYPVIQAQQTATKLFASIPSAGINSIALVGEIGVDYVVGFPRDRGIFDAAYSTDVNSAYAEAATVNGAQPLSKKGFASQTSAAYTIVSVIDMPNVLPYAIDMKPTLVFQHDFVGTSPVGVNTFVQNSAAASMGVTFNYLQAWSANIQYTNHFPIFSPGKFYGLIDRDFVSATVSYEF